ncbi:MAG: FAD-dependent oxidoreductase [Gemmatimonadaceae bacterium]
MRELFDRDFDVLVIGGGITGCGVARDAAMRGLSVALVERDDFASGTSGRSSRLIHGGIRYLEQARFKLVHESIRERQILLTIAPHLVKPLAFTWPIYQGARIGRLKLSAGLALYQLMALGRSHRPSLLGVKKTLEREPSLEKNRLKGGAVYYDAATDDSRLTVATAVSASDNGAVVVNHVSATRILRASDRAIGAELRSQYTKERGDVRARVVVNATGVWQNGGNAIDHGVRSRGSKGVHIAVPRERIGNHDAVTMISSVDGRVMFCLPAGRQAIIGTTDTWTDESPEAVHASTADVDYLLRSANSYFPDARLTFDDVVSAWAGIRPLVATQSNNPTSASREHSIVADASGVISVTGGKLTTYRAMAAEVVDRVQQTLGQNMRRAPTDTLPLETESSDDEIRRIGQGDPQLTEPLVAGLVYTPAHLVHGVKRRMAKTLSDLLIRRLHLAFETRDHGRDVASPAAEVVAPLLGWDERTKHARISEYNADVERMFAIS